MTPKVTCAKIGCKTGQEPTWCPVLVVHAPVALRNERYKPIRARLSLRLCEACKEASKLNDFLSNTGWERIVFSVQKAGKVTPQRDLTELEFDLVGVEVDPMTPFYQIVH